MQRGSRVWKPVTVRVQTIQIEFDFGTDNRVWGSTDPTGFSFDSVQIIRGARHTAEQESVVLAGCLFKTDSAGLSLPVTSVTFTSV